MNIVLLIGHRGTGKSSYLRELEVEYSARGLPLICRDLDEEIEKSLGLSVNEIFAQKGEPFFRQQEEQTLFRLHQELNGLDVPVFIALGAGYDRSLPEPSHIIWLQRPTDSSGRIFFNRPRLRTQLSPLEESIKLFKERNYRFEQFSDETLIRPEGFEKFEIWDRIFFHLEDGPIRGGITLLPQHFRQFASWTNHIQRRLRWGIDFFEARDDLLSDKMLRLAIQEIDANKLLLSFRSKQPSLLHQVDFSTCNWDWAFELGPCPFGQPMILSLHDKGDSTEDALLRLEDASRGVSHMKVSVMVDSFEELESLHHWWLEEPLKRSFLPRSRDGRWMWYRCLMGRSQRLSFFREDNGSAPDQPTFADWVRTRSIGSSFAAILGDPVSHSRTPAEHGEFFASRGLHVLPVLIREDEDAAVAIKVLEKLGLRAAAVTSPLKTKAFALASSRTPEALLTLSANTLALDEKTKRWTAHNTDLMGLKKFFEDVKMPKPIAVWGGGGLLSSLQLCLKQGHFFSARSGELRPDQLQLAKSPKTIIWAVGADRMTQGGKFPPPSWTPELIVDLNYSENSPGREYALKTGAKYVSGLDYFRHQALAQRLFWKQNL